MAIKIIINTFYITKILLVRGFHVNEAHFSFGRNYKLSFRFQVLPKIIWNLILVDLLVGSATVRLNYFTHYFDPLSSLWIYLAGKRRFCGDQQDKTNIKRSHTGARSPPGYLC